MTAPPAPDRPTTVDPAELRRVLVHLGLDACAEHAPHDPDEEASGLLAALLAVVQWHIQARRADAQTIARGYHQTRNALGFPCGGCRNCTDD